MSIEFRRVHQETGGVVTGRWGAGRILFYASDPAPHWGINFEYWEGGVFSVSARGGSAFGMTVRPLTAVKFFRRLSRGTLLIPLLILLLIRTKMD